jgi:hypothetical protein
VRGIPALVVVDAETGKPQYLLSRMFITNLSPIPYLKGVVKDRDGRMTVVNARGSTDKVLEQWKA